MVSKVFWAQHKNPIKNDWWLQVKDDLEEFQLSHLQLDEIKNINKNKFKKIKAACKKVSLEYLCKENSSKSKVKHIEYSSLVMQKYLRSVNIYNSTKKFMFKLRTRMLNVGFNYGKKYQCRLCFFGNDDQAHLMQCIKLRMKHPFLTENIHYNDIFEENETKQENIGKIMQRLFRTRKEILDSNMDNIS